MATATITEAHAAKRAEKAVRIATFLRRQLGLTVDVDALRLASDARWTEIARLAGERWTHLSAGTVDLIISLLEDGAV